MISFFIEGEPVPCARARVTRFGSYTPKKTKDWQTHVMWTAKLNYRDDLLTGPLKFTMTFYFKRPKSIKPDVFYCIGRSDIDNYIKSILDPLHNVIFKNDNQVAFLFARKLYASNGQKPGVEVIVEELDEL